MDRKLPAGAPPSAGKALIMLPVIAALIAGYIAIGGLLGIEALFAGFFFLLYWAGIRHADPKEYAPALLGGLSGLVLAWLLHMLPAKFGIAGMTAAILMVFAAVYMQIRNSFPLVINLAFMLFLTLATVPILAQEADFVGMGAAILLSAGYFGGALFLVAKLGRGRTAATEPA